MENKGRYVQSAWRRAWIMFDLDNGHKCGRNDVGKGYLWVFETKAKALAHRKEQHKLPFGAKLSEPILIKYDQI